MANSSAMHVVILAGGAGTRLWPVSRRSQPKQFQALLTDRTMLEETYDRVLPLSAPERIWVVTGAESVEIVRRQLPDLPESNLLGEPVGRNSAPAAALAVARIAKLDPEATLLVTPADSYILDAAAYRDYLSLAAEVAQAGPIVVLGIISTSPNINYGYIKRGLRLDRPGSYQVERFTEKPNLFTAAQYVADGGYYWNMGQFVFRAGVFMEKCDQYLPEVAERVRRLAETPDPSGALLAEIYETMPSISLDYGIAEKEPNLAVIPVAVEWSDLGN
jgi:mannose-1-phosphate guanylyltransferase